MGMVFGGSKFGYLYPYPCLNPGKTHRFIHTPAEHYSGLSIVLAINSIFYTKSGNFFHRSAYRLSIISRIVTVSRLYFMSVCSTICTKSTVIVYKDCYKQPLYFRFPSVTSKPPPSNNQTMSCDIWQLSFHTVSSLSCLNIVYSAS